MTRARGTTNEAHRVEWRTPREGRKGGGKVDNQLSLCGSVLTNVPLDVYSSKGGGEFGERLDQETRSPTHKLLFPLQMFPPFSSDSLLVFTHGDKVHSPKSTSSISPFSLSFLSLFPSLSFLFLFPSLALLIAASSTSTSRGIAFVSG